MLSAVASDSNRRMIDAFLLHLASCRKPYIIEGLEEDIHDTFQTV